MVEQGNEQGAVMSVPEAARYLRVGEATMWRLITQKAVASALIGEKRRIVRRVDLDKYVDKLIAEQSNAA